MLRSLEIAAEKCSTMQADISKIDCSFNQMADRVIRIEARVEQAEQQAVIAAQVQAGNDKFAQKIINNDTKREAELAICKSKVRELQAELGEESRRRNDLESHGRIMCMEISGLKAEQNDNCKGLVSTLMEILKCDATSNDIDVCHRKKAGGIIVHFTSRRARDELYEKRFELRGLCATMLGLKTRSNIYFNESLSYDTSRLMKAVREKTRDYNNALRPDEHEKKIKVRTESIVIFSQ